MTYVEKSHILRSSHTITYKNGDNVFKSVQYIFFFVMYM